MVFMGISIQVHRETGIQVYKETSTHMFTCLPVSLYTASPKSSRNVIFSPFLSGGGEKRLAFAIFDQFTL